MLEKLTMDNFDEDLMEFEHYESADLVNLLAEGEGTFQITQVIPSRSKSSGNRMFVVTAETTDQNGKTFKLDNYLVLTLGDEAGMKRLATGIKNIAYAINKPEIYDGGLKKLRTSDFLGGRGKCFIKTQQSSDARYPDPKSIISKWVDGRPAPTEPVAGAKTDFDDDLNF